MIYPQNLINNLPIEQKEVFLKILGKKENEEIAIEKELSNLISPFNGVFQKQLSYVEILKKVANHHQIKIENLNDKKKIEEEIFVFKIKENFKNLSLEEQKKIQEELTKISESSNIDASQLKALGAIGTLTVANLSGFGMYLMASTVVGGVSGALGITLPFAFYTGMSSFLSFISGPVGWTIGLGALAYSLRNENLNSISNKVKNAFKSAKNLVAGNYEIATVIIVQICANRIILNEKLNSEIEKLNYSLNSKSKLQENLDEELSNVDKKINELQNEKKIIRKKIDDILSEISKEKISIEYLKSKLF